MAPSSVTDSTTSPRGIPNEPSPSHRLLIGLATLASAHASQAAGQVQFTSCEQLKEWAKSARSASSSLLETATQLESTSKAYFHAWRELLTLQEHGFKYSTPELRKAMKDGELKAKELAS